MPPRARSVDVRGPPPAPVVARLIRLTAGVAAISALVTVLVATLPFARFAYRGPAMHAALETAASLVALLVACLVLFRFRRHRRVSDLMLFAALAILTSTNALFSALPSTLGRAPGTFSTWAPVGGRLLSALVLAAAAFAPAVRVRRPTRAVVAVIGCGAAALALIAAVVALLGSRLPMAIEPDLSPDASGRPLIVGHPAVLVLQIVVMLLYAAAAAGFMRTVRARNDELIAWFAIASVLWAFSRLNYFLFPSLYSNWVYSGDLFRLAAHVTLLVGAFREIAAYQRELIEASALAERRRVARDLHDGLAQELAFVVMQSRRLASGGSDPSVLRHLRTAAERALDLSRDVIAALARPAEEQGPLDVVVAQAARDVADRAGVALELIAEDGIEAGPEVRGALLPIVREGVANAVRHGQARTVTIDLREDDGLRLRILDDGIGFDPTSRRDGHEGFGLSSMRERTAAAGGTLTVVSRAGHGTLIEVMLPLSS